MRHADHDFPDAVGATLLDDVIEHRDQAFSAFEREALLGHVVRAEEGLEGLAGRVDLGADVDGDEEGEGAGGDENEELVDSAEWRRLVANPQIRIYETGRSDAVGLGGETHYGKMHAKFIVGEDFGWVGTSNFDYRSRLLNNEMGDFNAGPGLTDSTGLIGTPANLAEPGKRMLSSMTPTIVAKDGKPFMAIGSPGGRTIINTVLQVILNVLDYGMTMQPAITAPRVHSEGDFRPVLVDNDRKLRQQRHEP